MNAEQLVLVPADAALLVIDVQERLAGAMQPEAMTRAARSIAALIEGAKLLGLPVVLTEQYKKGLGPTVEAVRAALPPGTVPIEKMEFSCVAAPAARARLLALGRKQVIACGMETHICVFQTVRDLLREGFSPFVPQDAVVSRSPDNHRVGLSLMDRAGAVITSTETVLFDLLGKAGTAEFKAISALIK